MKITTALAVFLGVSALSTGAAADQFYKWTDAQGVTHYSADPPPKSATSSSEVKVSTKVPGGSGEGASASDKQRADAKKAADKGSDKDAKPDQAKTDAGKAPPAQYAEKCKGLQANLKAMQEHSRVKMTNDKGEVSVLSDEEKQRQMDDTQRQIKAFCQ